MAETDKGGILECMEIFGAEKFQPKPAEPVGTCTYTETMRSGYEHDAKSVAA